MATTTRLVMEQRVAEAIGDYYSITTTGAGSATTLVATPLQDLPGGNDDDAFENWHFHVTSGAATGESRRASAYAQSTSTVTVSRAYTAGAPGSGVTVVAHRHPTDDYYRCISRAIEELFPHVYLPIRDETLVVDNLLSNSDFETYAAANFTGWALAGAGASIAESTTILRHGADCVALTSAAATATYTQTLTVNTNELVGKTVSFKMWVYATAASAARIRVRYDGSNYFSSSYHSGEDQWELLEATGTFGSGTTEVVATLEVATGTLTGRFDAGWLAIGPVHRYTLPTSITRLYRVEEQFDELKPEGLYEPVSDFSRGRRLRLSGKGLLTRPSSDTATTEVGEPEVNLIVEYAAMLMNELLAGRAAQAQRSRYEKDVVYWRQKVETHLARFKSGGMSAQGGGNWRVERDSTSSYLIIPQWRA